MQDAAFVVFQKLNLPRLQLSQTLRQSWFELLFVFLVRFRFDSFSISFFETAHVLFVKHSRKSIFANDRRFQNLFLHEIFLLQNSKDWKMTRIRGLFLLRELGIWHCKDKLVVGSKLNVAQMENLDFFIIFWSCFWNYYEPGLSVDENVNSDLTVIPRNKYPRVPTLSKSVILFNEFALWTVIKIGEWINPPNFSS